MLQTVGKCLAGFLYGGCLYHVSSEHFFCLIKCEGDSMYPTINADPAVTDHVLVEKFWSSRRRNYKKNDIIVLTCPDEPEKLICKRITYVAGENTPKTTPLVPRCHVWVEGDNKEFSHDSRIFGPVPLGLVQGRVILRVWPPRSVGWIT